MAEADLDEIWLYIAGDNPAAADALADRIDSDLATLARHPAAGRLRPELPGFIRTFPVHSYLLVYRPIADGIELLRVLHGARNWHELLRD